MLIPIVIMGILAVILVIIGYRQGNGAHITGMKSAMTMTIQVLPLLLLAFIVAGMVQAILPRETLVKWIGTESGLRGIFIGAFAGGLTPGGPYTSLPIVAGFLKAGAGIGTMVAFLTGWSLYAFSRLPMDVGILGWKFALIRFVSVFIFPPLAGLIAHLLFGHARL